MTDSRVSPQATEATARALYGADGYDVENWDRDKGEDWAADYRPAAEIALAAAVPLLCQPLQDEIDRLRAIVDAVEKLHKPNGRNILGYPVCAACTPLQPMPCPTLSALAAVPVGTGNPTQPRADD